MSEIEPPGEAEAEGDDGAMLDHALRYAKLGLRVFPVVAGEKRPAVKEWRDIATTDPAKVSVPRQEKAGGASLVVPPAKAGQSVAAVLSRAASLPAKIRGGKPGPMCCSALPVPSPENRTQSPDRRPIGSGWLPRALPQLRISGRPTGRLGPEG